MSINKNYPLISGIVFDYSGGHLLGEIISPPLFIID